MTVVKQQFLLAKVWSLIKQICNFNPLKLVSRGSETRIQVAKNEFYNIAI